MTKENPRNLDEARLLPHLRADASRPAFRFTAPDHDPVQTLVLSPKFAAKLPGDPFALRGVPVVARGVKGASPGTDPEGESVRRSERRRRAA